MLKLLNVVLPLSAAAILAGVATKIFNGFPEGIRQFVRRDRVFEPNMKKNMIYQERLQMYRKLFPTMRSFLADWSKITGE